jgi:hypothetical protein
MNYLWFFLLVFGLLVFGCLLKWSDSYGDLDDEEE